MTHVQRKGTRNKDYFQGLSSELNVSSHVVAEEGQAGSKNGGRGGSIRGDSSIKLFAGRRREKIAPINRKPHHTEEGMLPTCLLGIVNIC